MFMFLGAECVASINNQHMKASACSSLPGSLLNGPLHSEREWQREIGTDRDRTWKREGGR